MIFYKYMPFRADFFENFMIRATPARALNDPFELNFSKEQVKEYQENRGVFDNDYDIDEAVGNIQSSYDDLGIISFSENYLNTVMWSHYAKEHTGISVQFNLSEKDRFFENDFGNNFFGDIHLTPKKVNYNREFPKITIIDQLSSKELDKIRGNNEFFWKRFNEIILLNKSFDWSYEQELRIIVDLKDADYISFSFKEKDKCKYRDLLNSIRKECQKDERIEFSDKPKNDERVISITYPKLSESKYDDVGDQSIKQEIFRLTQYMDPIHLFRVNKDCIKTIFLGCKFNKDEESIKKIKLLENVRVYRMNMSDDAYSLVPNKLSDN